MKQGSTLFLKIVIVFIGIVALVGLLWFPQLEGRNVNADLVTIYFRDPFLVYVYVAAIPFFVALYQAFKLLGYIEQDKVFSIVSVRALRNIKYCALAIVGFLVVAILYIRLMAQGDDPAGPTMIGFVTIFTSVVIAIAAGVFQKLLQHAIDIKSENDLTV